MVGIVNDRRRRTAGVVFLEKDVHSDMPDYGATEGQPAGFQAAYGLRVIVNKIISI
jgi:hypothetical protein